MHFVLSLYFVALRSLQIELIILRSVSSVKSFLYCGFESRSDPLSSLFLSLQFFFLIFLITMATEAQLKSMQDQIAALVKGMEELKTENEKLKKASTSSSSSAGLGLLSSKSISVRDADLTRLKILHPR